MAAFDAIKLAERLQGLKREEYWLHLESGSPFDKYPAKQHARRVRDKLDQTNGLIYLPGQPARSNEDSDMPAPFRQRRYFYYLSGCNEPNCHVIYDIKNDTLSLFIPRINPERVIWNGRGSTPAEALDKYDIDQVYFIDELKSWLLNWFMYNRGICYILHESQAPSSPYFRGYLNSTSLQPAMNLARMVKDEHEIKLIKKANDISSEAHKQVLANILKFKNEAQVEGLFLDVCISKQAKQQAYDPIAASGPNAGTLHYDANNEDFDDRQLMCLDAGCEYDLYASDITRTFPLSGSWPTTEAEKIYKLVERMQEACIEKLAPGVRYLDLHILAHQIAIDGLLRLGILHNGTREEIYKAGTSRAFFPHGLGHHVGLEVHDVGQNELMSLYAKNPKYEKAPSLYPEDFHLPVYDEAMCMAPTDPQSPHLEEGNVVTVEPGIYFSAYALSYFYLPSPVHSKYINTEVVYRYFHVGGVRIEDDILITAKGYENLTPAPKGDAMLRMIQTQDSQCSDATSRRHSPNSGLEQRSIQVEVPLLSAPGISKKLSKSGPRRPSRAATAPVNGFDERESRDFEPFNGPSLFAGFKRSTKEDEVTEQRRVPSGFHCRRPKPQQLLTLCGVDSPDHEHIYMTPLLYQGNDVPIVAPKIFDLIPACNKCIVLSETVDRLRETLDKSEQSSPKLEQRQIEPAAARKRPEMQQIRPARPADELATKKSRSPFPPPAPYPVSNIDDFDTVPKRSSLEHGFHSHAGSTVKSLPSERRQRRSVTFDNFVQDSPQQIPNRTNPWQEPNVPRLRDSRSFIDPMMSGQDKTQSHAEVSGGAPTVRIHEQDIHHRALPRRPAPRPSLPILQPSHAENAPPPARRPSRRNNTDQLFTRENIDDRTSLLAERRQSLVDPIRQPNVHMYPSSNPYHRTSLVGPTASTPPPHVPNPDLRDRKLEDLRRAMEDLWRVKKDVERTLGTTLHEDGRGELSEK